jgi:thioredoxin-dependent peroxiredoxin
LNWPSFQNLGGILFLINKVSNMKIHKSYKTVLTFLACLIPSVLHAGTPLKVGDKAPDFALKTLDDQTVRLSELTVSSNVVLIVLRGWPGYQCPLCTRQVQDFIASAPVFSKSKARVVFVYPGPADDLKAHAKEFLGNKQWPKGFDFVTDPAFTMVNAYGLRWDAPHETAYPSTFILDRKGVVQFVQISHSHGDRTKASAILEAVDCLPEVK